MKITHEILREVASQIPYFDLLELDGIQQNKHGWQLGSIALYETENRSLFHSYFYDVSNELSDTALFRVMKFNFIKMKRSGYAIIFRDCENDTVIKEHFVGWVTISQEAKAYQWSQFMNQKIAQFLKKKQSA